MTRRKPSPTPAELDMAALCANSNDAEAHARLRDAYFAAGLFADVKAPGWPMPWFPSFRVMLDAGWVMHELPRPREIEEPYAHSAEWI